MHPTKPLYLLSSLLLAASSVNGVIRTTTTKTLTAWSTLTSTRTVRTTSTSTVVTTSTETDTTSTTTTVPVTKTLTRLTTVTHPFTVTRSTTTTKTFTHTITQPVTVNNTITNIVTALSTSTEWSAACPTPGDGYGYDGPPDDGGDDTTTGVCPGADGDYYQTDNGDQYQIFCNTDHGSDDMTAYLTWTDSLVDCVDHCSAVLGCVNVIWFHPDVRPKSSGQMNCYPKTNTLNPGHPNGQLDAAVLISQLPDDDGDNGYGDYGSSTSSYSSYPSTSSSYPWWWGYDGYGYGNGWPTPSPTSSSHSPSVTATHTSVSPSPSPSSGSCNIPASAQCFNIIGHGFSTVEGKTLLQEDCCSSPVFDSSASAYYINNADGYTYSAKDGKSIMATNSYGGGSNWMAFLPQNQLHMGSETWLPVTCSRQGGFALVCTTQGGISQLTVISDIQDDRSLTPMFGDADGDRAARPITLTTRNVDCPCGGTNVA